MKKIIIPILIIAAVLLLVFLPGRNKFEGVWKCSYYAMLNPQNGSWNEQAEEFRSLFLMKIYDNGKIIVSTSGNENEGTYITNKDTLNVNIKDIESQYVFDNNTLTLINHPRAKIEYIKIAKIEGE